VLPTPGAALLKIVNPVSVFDAKVTQPIIESVGLDELLGEGVKNTS
jgi:hypothetical protein